MILHDSRGIAISASPSGLKEVADHLNWLAKGSINRESSFLYPETRKSYPLLNHFEHTVNRIA